MIAFPTLLSTLLVYTLTSPTTTKASDLPLAGGSTNGWNKSQWNVGVDGVMGGKSTGDVTFDELSTTMDFHGTIVTDGGGFANVGRTFVPLDLTGHAGIVVTMEADGAPTAEKPYGFHLQLKDARPSRYGYAAAFAVPLAEDNGVGTGVYLPLGAFDRGSAGGYQCTGCALDVTQVDGMEIYALFQEGPFRVRVGSIIAVEDARSFVSPPVVFGSEDEIGSLIEATISSGSYVYDKGYRELCIAIYWSTINTVLEASEGVSDAVKGVACVGARRVSATAVKAENAWTLRYTLDAVLADIRGVDRGGNSPSWLPEKNDAGTTGKDCTGYTSYPPPTKEAKVCRDDPAYAHQGVVKKNCKWVSRSKKRDRLCRKNKVKKSCEIVCGACCADDPDGFELEGETQTCSNFLSSVQNKNKCIKAFISTPCAFTCGRCCYSDRDYKFPVNDTQKGCSFINNSKKKRKFCKDETKMKCGIECGCKDYTIKLISV